MTSPRPGIQITESDLRELEEFEREDWSEGLLLPELIEFVNQVTEHFRPREIGGDSRASPAFTPRTFRHYQTAGCIDPPERSGKRAIYRFRHYLQALLLRKLLWERVPSDVIRTLMAGKSTAEYKQLLLDGIEIVGRRPSGNSAPSPGDGSLWQRHEIHPGIELHLRPGFPALKSSDLKQCLKRIEAALRRHL